jgi:hypothetical protein
MRPDSVRVTATPTELKARGRPMPEDCGEPNERKGWWMEPKERGKVAGAGRGSVAGDVTFSKDVIDIADHGWIPFAPFSDPQVAAVGLKAAQAREKGIDVREAWLPVVRGYLL